MTSGKPKLLTKDDVLKAEDRATEIVEMPEWGGAVEVQALDAWQQSEYEQSLFTTSFDGKSGSVDVKANRVGENVRLAALGLSQPKMTEKELRTKSAATVNRIADAIRRLSGMDRKKEIAEAEGN